MIRNGEPYIPPYPFCPTERDGREFTVTPGMFNFVIADSVTDGVTPILLTDIGGLFYPEDGWDTDTHVATGMIEVPSSSRLAEIGRAILNHPDPRHVEARAGQIFCDRIKNCQGVTNGECWALGKPAIPEVIEQIADEINP